jgi:hypothetical protein
MTEFDEPGSGSFNASDFRKPSKYSGRTFIQPTDKVVTSVSGKLPNPISPYSSKQNQF